METLQDNGPSLDLLSSYKKWLQLSSFYCLVYMLLFEDTDSCIYEIKPFFLNLMLQLTSRVPRCSLSLTLISLTSPQRLFFSMRKFMIHIIYSSLEMHLHLRRSKTFMVTKLSLSSYFLTSDYWKSSSSPILVTSISKGTFSRK